MMESSDLLNRFEFHPADEVTGPQHDYWRTQCLALAHLANINLPEGREKSLAITHLEEVMMWGNAAIARAPRG